MRYAPMIAVAAAVFAAAPASAATYITDTATFTGLGDTIGSQFDKITLNSVTGTANGSGTYLINTVDFTVGVNSNTGGIYTGTFTNTATVDGAPFSYTVPYTITIGALDTIVIGGNRVRYGGNVVKFNTLTFTSGAGTVSGDLTATVAVPEIATWAMMILGMGAVGGVMRRRNAVQTIVSYV